MGGGGWGGRGRGVGQGTAQVRQRVRIIEQEALAPGGQQAGQGLEIGRGGKLGPEGCGVRGVWWGVGGGGAGCRGSVPDPTGVPARTGHLPDAITMIHGQGATTAVCFNQRTEAHDHPPHVNSVPNSGRTADTQSHTCTLPALVKHQDPLIVKSLWHGMQASCTAGCEDKEQGGGAPRRRGGGGVVGTGQRIGACNS